MARTAGMRLNIGSMNSAKSVDYSYFTEESVEAVNTHKGKDIDPVLGQARPACRPVSLAFLHAVGFCA